MRSFVFVFLFTFLVTFAILYVFGLVPESPSTTDTGIQNQSEPLLNTSPVVEDDASPVRITIEKIGLDSTVVNPASRDISILDNALLSGVVRYPSSGKLSDFQSMLLFGHSSGLPVIHNQAFKVFNRIKELEEGDIIRVYSEQREYLYRVSSVKEMKAEEAFVSIQRGEKKLTLSTCDSFGSKSDRFVVESDFVGSYPIET